MSFLKNIFSKQADKSTAPAKDASGSEDTPLETVLSPTLMLRKEAIFDRKERLTGYIFSMQQNKETLDDPLLQRSRDQFLLQTLYNNDAAWKTLPAFIPLSSESLDIPLLDNIRGGKVVLLIQLAERALLEKILPRLTELRERGLFIGLFRQPQNPAYKACVIQSNFGVLDVQQCEPSVIRDFSAAYRAGTSKGARLVATNIASQDEYQLCHRLHFDYFHGGFSHEDKKHPQQTKNAADPHKMQVLHIMRLVQDNAPTADLTEAFKRDPLLSFRILRYLNSPGIGLLYPVDSIAKALTFLGQNPLMRWLSVLLFSVQSPKAGDWLMVEGALTRGRMMELLGENISPKLPSDPLFLTGIFSSIDKLLRCSLEDALAEIPLPDEVRYALLEQKGRYAELLSLVKAGEGYNLEAMAEQAATLGLTAESVNQALLSATVWANEACSQWE